MTTRKTHIPSFYEKQLLWKKVREGALEKERLRLQKGQEEQDLADSNIRRKSRNGSRMSIIMEDLNRVSMILRESYSN